MQKRKTRNVRVVSRVEPRIAPKPKPVPAPIINLSHWTEGDGVKIIEGHIKKGD